MDCGFGRYTMYMAYRRIYITGTYYDTSHVLRLKAFGTKVLRFHLTMVNSYALTLVEHGLVPAFNVAIKFALTQLCFTYTNMYT